MKKIIQPVYWLLGCILWTLLLPGLFLFAPSPFGFLALTVLSGSMEPTISTGGVVLVDTHQKTPAPGDIITYQNGQAYVTHRVEEVTESGYVTRGDANDYADAGVRTQEDLVGRVVLFIPLLGYLIVFLQSRRGILTICILVFLNTLLWGIRELSEIKERNQTAESR